MKKSYFKRIDDLGVYVLTHISTEKVNVIFTTSLNQFNSKESPCAVWRGIVNFSFFKNNYNLFKKITKEQSIQFFKSKKLLKVYTPKWKSVWK